MKTKAQGLPINVVIIAALGLAVFVVLVIILTSQAGTFSKNVLTCEAKGGECVSENNCQYQKTSFKCPQKENVCCINPLSR